jgi:hypothetical protein
MTARPVLRVLQPAFDRVAVHVAQLLDSFVVYEDIEVKVPSLPEGTLRKPARDGDLQRLNRGCK